MKLSCDRKELAAAAKDAAKFLPRMTHMAVLEHLHLEAHSNQLMVSATNLDAGRTVEVEADITEEGRVLAPQNFAQIVAGAQGPSIEIETTETETVVSDGAARWKLAQGNIDDYPDITPDVDEEVEIPSWQKIRKIAESAGGKHSRPELQGVSFGEGIAATDSYKLAWIEAETPEAIVHAHAIRNLDAHVKTLRFGTRHVSAVLEDGLWWSRVVDGNFPFWRRLIDLNPVVTAEVSSEALDDALARAAMVGDPDHPVFMEFGNGITLTRAKDAFSETIDAEVKLADADGPFTSAFHIKRLRSMLGEDKLTLTLETEHKPMRLSGTWFDALLMPVRT